MNLFDKLVQHHSVDYINRKENGVFTISNNDKIPSGYDTVHIVDITIPIEICEHEMDESLERFMKILEVRTRDSFKCQLEQIFKKEIEEFIATEFKAG